MPLFPTGQGLKILDSMPDLQKKVYEVIVRRFLAIFYPPAVYQKVSIVAATISPEECFYTNNKILVEKGFLSVSEFSFKKKKENTDNEKNAYRREMKNKARAQIQILILIQQRMQKMSRQ